MSAPRVIFVARIDPDKLYYNMIKAIQDDPELVIINGNESKRHLDLAMLERGSYYYFELTIACNDKQSEIEFTTSKLEHEPELAKAIARTLPTILDRISRGLQ